MVKPLSKLKLHGFNNLTKSLSLSIYDINYAQSAPQQQAYIDYIDAHYNTDRLAHILNDVCHIIGANVLNTARQEYDPQGASVTMLVAEDEMATADKLEESEKPGPLPNSVVSHLDKSHICVHTYPESHPVNGISTFRADIEISTCGVISPLKALNYLIHCFNLDIVTLDYRVRGFTRDIDGNKHYIDHQINSIQNYLAAETCNKYQMIDVNIQQENLFHTKLMIKDFDLANYILGSDLTEFDDKDKAKITEQLQTEMKEIFYGRNLA